MTAFHLMTGPLAALLALLPAPRPPDPLRSDTLAPACHGVEGRMDARAARLGIDLHGFKVTGGGSIHGGLEGDLRLEVRRAGRHGSDTEVAIRLTAATAAGPVRMEGTALAARERSEDPLHRVRGWLDVTDPSAGGANGRVRVEGTADTGARVISIRYSGELCGDSGARLAVVPAARGEGSRP